MAKKGSFDAGNIGETLPCPITSFDIESRVNSENTRYVMVKDGEEHFFSALLCSNGREL